MVYDFTHLELPKTPDEIVVGDSLKIISERPSRFINLLLVKDLDGIRIKNSYLIRKPVNSAQLETVKLS